MEGKKKHYRNARVVTQPQRLREKLPEVTGTSRGNPEFPEVTRERYSHLFQNFPQFVVIHTVEGFSIINEAEVDIFLEFPWFFYDPTNVGSLISGSSAFSKSSLYIWKFSVHVLLKPVLKDFEHYLASM